MKTEIIIISRANILLSDEGKTQSTPHHCGRGGSAPTLPLKLHEFGFGHGFALCELNEIEATINAPRISATGQQNPLPITGKGSQVISYLLEQLYPENSATQKLHYAHF